MFGVLYDFELNSILQMQFFKYETCFEDYPYKQAHQETLDHISTPLQFFSQRKITVSNDGNDGGEAEVEVEEIIGGELKFMENNMFLTRFLQSRLRFILNLMEVKLLEFYNSMWITYYIVINRAMRNRVHSVIH